MNGKAFLSGIITGTIIGGGVTLLTTPKSGRDLKKGIIENSKQFKNKVSTVKSESIQLKNEIKETTKDGVSTIINVSNDLKSSVEEWKNDVEPNVKNIYENINEIQKTITEMEQRLSKI